MQERVQISEVQRIVGEKVDMRGLLEQLQHLFRPPFSGRAPTQVAESVDALVSNTSEAIRAGSTPALGTSDHVLMRP